MTRKKRKDAREDPADEPMKAGPAEALELAGEEPDELTAVAAERDELREKFLRARADLENYRKRASRDLEEMRLFAISSLAREVLQVRDDLERTLAAAGSRPGDLEALKEGVKLMRDQLDKVLSSFGVCRIETRRRPFDPNLHEAVAVEMTDDFPDHTVTEELQSGFTLHDRLLRPAKVKVARAPSPRQEEKVEPGDDDREGADGKPSPSG